MNLSRELSLRLPGSLPPALKGVFLGEAKQRSPSFLHLRVFFPLSIMSLSLSLTYRVTQSYVEEANRQRQFGVPHQADIYTNTSVYTSHTHRSFPPRGTSCRETDAQESNARQRSDVGDIQLNKLITPRLQEAHRPQNVSSGCARRPNAQATAAATVAAVAACARRVSPTHANH